MPYEIIQDHERFMQSAWDRKEWIDVGEVHCPVLCLEMELLFNIAHLVQHQFDVSLKHYLDIAGLLVLCRGQLNWDGIGTLFRDFGLEQAFALTTGFLSTMMRLSWMSQAPRLNSKDSAQQEFDASLRNLLALLDEERLLDVRVVIWSFRIAFGNREGFGNKIAYVIKTLFPASMPFLRQTPASHNHALSQRTSLRQTEFAGKGKGRRKKQDHQAAYEDRTARATLIRATGDHC